MLVRRLSPLALLLLAAAPARAQAEIDWIGTYDGSPAPNEWTLVDDIAAFPGGGVASLCTVRRAVLVHLYEDVALDVVRWDVDGNRLWATRLPFPTFTYAIAIAVDELGNSYAAFEGGVDSGKIVAVDAGGVVSWTAHLPVGDALRAIAARPGGGVYAASRGPTADAAIEVDAWSPTGAHSWRTSVQGPYGGVDFPYVVVVDPAGDVFVGGFSAEPQLPATPTPYHAALVKLDANGQVLWSSTLAQNTSAQAIAFAPNGDVAIGGELEPVLGGPVSTLVARFDASGAPLWTRGFLPPGAVYGVAIDVEVASDESVWAAASVVFHPPYRTNVASLRYAIDGTTELEYVHDVPGGEDSIPCGVVLGSAGQAWVGGATDGSPGPPHENRARLLEFDSSSALVAELDFDVVPGAIDEDFVPKLILAEDGRLVWSGSTRAQGGGDALVLAIDVGESPLAYCTGKTNSLGCVPETTFTGASSASASSGFVVRAENELNQTLGIVLYSLAGEASVPFRGGTLCIAAPLRRTPPTSSGGSPLPANDCSGAYAIDMNAFASGALGGNPDPSLSVPGTAVWMQAWGRDPGFAAPDNTSLSDGLRYFVLP